MIFRVSNCYVAHALIVNCWEIGHAPDSVNTLSYQPFPIDAGRVGDFAERGLCGLSECLGGVFKWT